MPYSVSLLRKIETVSPELREVLFAILEEVERGREESVTKREFNDFARKTEESFQKVWKVIGELAEAQKRTEAKVEELAQAQKKTEEELARFGRDFNVKIGALGARWGLGSESAFRKGIEYILKDTGFTVEHYRSYDRKGTVFGRPDQVELDLIIRDGRLIVVEIKSSINRADIALFERKVAFYEREEKRRVAEKVVISPFIDPRGTEGLASSFGIRLITDPEELG